MLSHCLEIVSKLTNRCIKHLFSGKNTILSKPEVLLAIENLSRLSLQSPALGTVLVYDPGRILSIYTLGKGCKRS